MALKPYKHRTTGDVVKAKHFGPPVEVGGTIEGYVTQEDADGVFVDLDGVRCDLGKWMVRKGEKWAVMDPAAFEDYERQRF